MLGVSLAFILAALAPWSADAAFCNKNVNITSPMNNHSVYAEEPVFVKSVKNGEMYALGNNESLVHVLHLYGKDGYELGYAQGELLGSMANDTLGGMWDYFSGEILKRVNKATHGKDYNLPPWLVDDIVNLGLELALDKQSAESSPFMNPEIFKEYRGLADATGIDYNKIVRIHLIGEITRGQCSFYGAYGNATKDSKTLQLRALDWDTGAGLQNHPTITIYHPPQNASGPSKMGQPWANVGWAGWVGTVTGMSSSQIGISEISISFPDKEWFGTESYVGIPFVFLERQIVQYGTSVFDAMRMIKEANRTCDLVLGVADGVHKTARMVAYSQSEANIFDAENLQPLAPWHPRLNDTVYCGMDWICPYYQHLLYKQLEKFHGTLTPELSISSVTAVVGTGDLHIAVMDLTEQVLFVANARGSTQQGSPNAYQRQFNRLDMAVSFSKKYGQGRNSPPNRQLEAALDQVLQGTE